MRSNRLWKKSLICLLITAVLMSVAGCGGKKAEVKEDDKQNTEETAPATAEAGGIKIDYKTSELYTEEEMNAAVAEIMKEFVGSLELPEADKKRLMEMSPASYVGMAEKLASLI